MVQLLIICIFPAALVVYDVFSLRKVHRVTWIASLMLLVMWLTRIPLGQTAPWQAFARMIHG